VGHCPQEPKLLAKVKKTKNVVLTNMLFSQALCESRKPRIGI
jgi:hypothetical protein